MPKKKDEPLFVEPEFDERQFIYEEKERAKAIIVVFVIGALIGLLSGYFSLLGVWYYSILLLFVFLLFLRFILNGLRVEIPKRTSHRILMGGEFILTWLVFWILFLNPPIHVASGPQISDLQVQDSSGTWVNAHMQSSNVFQIAPTESSLRMHVSYKYEITSIAVTQAPPGNPGNTQSVSSNYVGNYLYFNLTGTSTTTLLVTITAHSTEKSNTYSFTLNFSGSQTSTSVLAAQINATRAGVV